MKTEFVINLKRLMIVLLFIVMISWTIPAAAVEKGPLLKGDGSGYVTHLGSSELIEVNKVYDEKLTEFRGVWVSPLVGNLNKYISMDQYKNEIISILDTMDYYNMNVMIFHIRIMNDAFYESVYNKWSSYYSTNPDWEALSWIIEECHKRGIEFHAWMNPYRVTNNTSRDLNELAKEFPVLNPASDPKNLLKGTNSIILNPGIGSVRDFLVNTCMEVVKNYDVDAIHFDDYFYDAGIDDTETRNAAGVPASQTADWRRKQVDMFIEELSKSIRKHNDETGKCVQLGISPSGVWQSGNGKVTYDANGNAITNGSNTKTSFEHYGDYLYSDTLKWINEEWIDYILPQTYWAIEHPLCAYYDLLEWWDQVVKYKKVKLYSGMGLYLNTSTGGYSWYTNPNEAYNQILICNTFENVEGIAIFDYSAVKSTISNSSKFVGVKNVWDIPKILPELENTNRFVPTKVTNLEVSKNSKGNLLTWDETDDAKFYVVYRSEKEVTYGPTEVIDIIGHLGSNGKIAYTDLSAEDGKEYYYAVKPQSNSLTLGQGEKVKLDLNNTTDKLATLGDFDVLNVTDSIIPGSTFYISWGRITYPFGSNIKYELYYSLDDGAEQKVTNIEYKNYLYTYSIPTTEVTKKIKVTLKAYNDVAESVYEYESELKKGLGVIKNFACLDTPYANKDANFVWSLYNIEDVDYKLEYSFDMSNWTELTGRKKALENVMGITVRLPKQDGFVYFRVTGTKDDQIGYSDVLKCEVLNYLGAYKNFTIDGEDLKDEYVACEGDTLKIAFDKFTQENVSYNLYVSADLENWQTGRQYNSRFTIDTKGEQVVVNLPIKYFPIKFYAKVQVTTSTGESYSEIFVVYVKVDENWLEDILDSLDKNMKGSMNELDIYN